MKDELLRLGLTKGEVDVYLALLKLGPSTNSPIARQAQMQSSSVYYCLNSLIEKGFITYVLRGSRKHFSAVDPKAITQIIDTQMTELQEHKERIKEILPQLEAQQGIYKQKSVAEVHEGFRGMQAIFNQILTELQPGESYEAFAIEQDEHEPNAIRNMFVHHNKQLKAKNITLRILAPRKLKAIFERMYGKEFLETYQHVRYTEELTPLNTTIYKDNVVTHSKHNDQPIAFSIHDAGVAHRYKEYFNEVWKRAKE